MNPRIPPPPDADDSDSTDSDTDAPDTDAPDATTPTTLPIAASIVLVALGGAGGALCRYELGLRYPATGGAFPWATELVNISGAAVLGLVLTLLTGRRSRRPWARVGRPLVATGFIGAYTTWSTFMVETVQLTRTGAVGVALAYLALSLVGGLAAATAGVALAGRLTR